MKLRNKLKEKKKKFCENKFLLREIDGGYSLECDFCLQRKIKVNKNLHIRNRNKVKFWNREIINKVLVCFSCLFEKKELEIQPSRKVIFSIYKNRYLEE